MKIQTYLMTILKNTFFLASLYMIFSLFNTLRRIKTVIPGMQRKAVLIFTYHYRIFKRHNNLEKFFPERIYSLIFFIHVLKTKLVWFQSTLSFFVCLFPFYKLQKERTLNVNKGHSILPRNEMESLSRGRIGKAKGKYMANVTLIPVTEK